MIPPTQTVARAGRYQRSAFTRTDLVVALAVLTVLAALVMVPLSLGRQRARLGVCLNNLQQVAQAVARFATDHQGTLPGHVPGRAGDAWWWYKEDVKGYLGMTGLSTVNDRQFACPVDRGYSDPKPFSLNARFDYSSYVFNGVTLPGLPNISGWKTAAINQPQRTLLVMEWAAHAPLSWHRSRTGQANTPFYSDAECVVAFADGHVNLTKIYYDGYAAAYTRDPIAGYDYKYSGK